MKSIKEIVETKDFNKNETARLIQISLFTILLTDEIFFNKKLSEVIPFLNLVSKQNKINMKFGQRSFSGTEADYKRVVQIFLNSVKYN